MSLLVRDPRRNREELVQAVKRLVDVANRADEALTASRGYELEAGQGLTYPKWCPEVLALQQECTVVDRIIHLPEYRKVEG